MESEGSSRTNPKPKGQLNFHNAMQDFKNMFPGMDEEVIEAVLRSNDGLVDVTVDQLISMAAADPAGGAAVGQPAEHRSHLAAVHRWRPPLLLPLPDDFLRLEPPPAAPAAARGGGASSGGGLNSAGLLERLEENRRQLAALGAEPDPELARYLEDERVALMMQNDEFMEELRRNREFMDALDIDTAHLEGPQWRDYEALDEPTQTSQRSGDPSHVAKYPDDEAFKERLKHMGKASRKKFSQLARLFHFNRRGGARHMLGQGPVPSGDQLLLGDDQLTADDLDQEYPPPSPPFVDRHTVETSSSRESGRPSGHQMV